MIAVTEPFGENAHVCGRSVLSEFSRRNERNPRVSQLSISWWRVAFLLARSLGCKILAAILAPEAGKFTIQGLDKLAYFRCMSFLWAKFTCAFRKTDNFWQKLLWGNGVTTCTIDTSFFFEGALEQCLLG
jgi:hypothetical protein